MSSASTDLSHSIGGTEISRIQVYHSQREANSHVTTTGVAAVVTSRFEAASGLTARHPAQRLTLWTMRPQPEGGVSQGDTSTEQEVITAAACDAHTTAACTTPTSDLAHFRRAGLLRKAG
jgi:hypothetical protein